LSIVLKRQPVIWDYISILKPKETILLAFIGVCAGLIAAGGSLSSGPLGLLVIALVVGSAGSNGLTNYLDRKVDAKMARTMGRALAAGRINPPQKALPLIIGLILSGLALAWVLHPLCFLFGLIGVIASGVWRKTITCTFFGIIAGCSPVLIGWFAMKPVFDAQILLLSLLVAIWTPIHVWSVMIANRADYVGAGLSYFPLNLSGKAVVRILFVLSIFLYLISLLLYMLGYFHLLYLIVSSMLGLLMLFANAVLLHSATSGAAWRVYKLSAFPYLGIIFLSMTLDILLI
jgi:protoheme IX farnesyltransferase